MKYFFYTILILVPLDIFCQTICSPDIIHFRRQSQVDSFPIIFKGCDYIDSTIHITKSGILNIDSLYFVKRFNHLRIVDTYVKDLNGLLGLDSVGVLEIHGNRYLKNLQGLKSIKKANTISLGSNDSISSLEGLKLDSVFYSLNISFLSLNQKNTFMKNLKGLKARYINRLNLSNNTNFEELSGAEIGDLKKLRISHNHTLKNLAYLNPKEIIEISYSNSIIDISELNELLKIQDYDLMNLRLLYLANINNCAIDYICQNIDKEGFLTVENNGTGCNSIAEIKAACLLSTSKTPEQSLQVMPNPFWDEIRIEWPENLSPGSQCKIVNTQGKLVYHHHVLQNEKGILLSALDWPAGVYFYHLQSPNALTSYQGRLIKL